MLSCRANVQVSSRVVLPAHSDLVPEVDEELKIIPLCVHDSSSTLTPPGVEVP